MPAPRGCSRYRALRAGFDPALPLSRLELWTRRFAEGHAGVRWREELRAPTEWPGAGESRDLGKVRVCESRSEGRATNRLPGWVSKANGAARREQTASLR